MKEIFRANAGWMNPLVAAVVIYLGSVIAMGLNDPKHGIVVPPFALMVAKILSVFAMVWAGIRARLTDSVAASIFCYLVALAGLCFAVYDLLHALGLRL